jgi:hypothetical protein
VPLEVFVRADQGIAVRSRDRNGAVISEQRITRGELAAGSKRRRQGRRAVRAGGRRQTRAETVLQVLDELRKRGVRKSACG